MKACELMKILEQHPNAQIVVMRDENYEEKETFLTPYVDTDGRVVIQFWSGPEDENDD